jgi:hypothetical protein
MPNRILQKSCPATWGKQLNADFKKIHQKSPPPLQKLIIRWMLVLKIRQKFAPATHCNQMIAFFKIHQKIFPAELDKSVEHEVKNALKNAFLQYVLMVLYNEN